VSALPRPSPPTQPAVPPIVLVMGVSGSGKTTIGRLLAARLGVSFADGDDLHPPGNVAKMAAGHPLTDHDRWPWLTAIGQWMSEQATAGRGGVVACSALRLVYRDLLRRLVGPAATVRLVHLDPDRDALRDRMQRRDGHFMPAALLDSQLATLEPPGEGERPIVVRDAGARPPEAIVDEIVAALG
jgi:gluconokinase